MKMTRFQRFTIAMLKAIYQKDRLCNCPECDGKSYGVDKEVCPSCYGFGALPNSEFYTEAKSKQELDSRLRL